MSREGFKLGYKDERFPYFFDLIRAVNHLREIQTYPRVSVFENIYPLGELNQEVVDTTTIIKSFLGTPAVVDTVSCGSTAHRLRCICTNFITPQMLENASPDEPELPPLELLLERYHSRAPVLQNDTPPFATVNKIGEKRRALPTLVSFPRSHQFYMFGNHLGA